MRALAVLAVLLFATPAALAQTDEQRAERCFGKIDKDAEGAYQDALTWLAVGNAPGARHCAALALIALGEPDEGAAQLELLANAPDSGGVGAKSLYLAQAGNAWLIAHQPQKAVDALTNALKFHPTDGELFKDRARARIALKQWADASGDLDKAIVFSAVDAEAYRLRGLARLKLNQLEDAWSDVNAAMRLAPKDINVLLLRGDVREAMRTAGMEDPAGLDTAQEPQTRIVGN